MLTQDDIRSTTEKIVKQAASPVRVVVFGSYGRGDATENSDLDLLVVEESLEDYTGEYVSLRKAIGSIGVGVDLLLISNKDYEQRKDWFSSPIYWAHREGKIVYGS
jgi:predicted nucleotidyltransferase